MMELTTGAQRRMRTSDDSDSLRPAAALQNLSTDDKARLFDSLVEAAADLTLQKLAPVLRRTADAEMERLLDVKEAADLLGIAPGTLLHRAQKGEIPRVKNGARVLFRPADLRASVEARTESKERLRKASQSVHGIAALVR